jgi:hypothetical protein
MSAPNDIVVEREQRRYPTTIAARCPEAHEVLFENDYP